MYNQHRSPILAADQHNWATMTDMRPLPGGKRILVDNRNIIKIWPIESCEMLGATSVCLLQGVRPVFDFEVMRGGKGLTVAAIFISTDGPMVSAYTFHVIYQFLIHVANIALFACFRLIMKPTIAGLHLNEASRLASSSAS